MSSQPPPPTGPPRAGPRAATPWWQRWWVLVLVAVVGLVVLTVVEPDAPPSDDAAVPPPATTAPAAPSPSPERTRTEGTVPATTTSPRPDPVDRVRGDTASVVARGTVAGVVDGDTVDLADGTRIRLAIVDTPEVHGGREPCGPEASDFTRQQVAGRRVAVLRPAGAPTTDAYGRTLGEVVRLDDGWSLNVELARAGLGTVDERFTDEDPDLARRARAAQADADSPACGSVDSEAAPPPAAGPQPRGGDCAAGYEPCVPPYPPDLDCGDVDGPVRVTGDDPHGLDGNGDGVGCEG